MIREQIALQMDHDPHFRWRGEAVTRIENLSDIVFALALGMIVAAPQPPETFGDLKAYLFGIIPVTLSFAMMLQIWQAHFTFFRRYGVADKWIIFLNVVLLFCILYIAYPLRFIFDSLFAFVIGQMGDNSRLIDLGLSSYRDAGQIMAYFGLGYVAVFVLVLAMYFHALSKAELLGLSRSEQIMTKRSIYIHIADVVLGALVVVFSAFTVVGPFAGFLLALNMPINILIRLRMKLPDIVENPA